jgi:O-antigen/teichoic acid export membrane protein
VTNPPNSERKRLWTSGAAASTSVAVNFFSSAIVSAIAFRQIGPEELGSWALLWSTLGLGVVFLLGLPTLITPAISLCRDERRDSDIPALFTRTHWAVIVVAIGWLALSLLADDLLLDLVALRVSSESRLLLWIAVSGVFATQLSIFYAGTLDGFGLMRRRAGLSSLSVLTYSITALCLVPYYGLPGLAIAFLVQGLVSMTSMGLAVYSQISRIQPRPTTGLLRLDIGDLIRQGGSLQLVGILVGAVEWGSRLLVSAVGTMAIVGYFDLAQKVVLQLRNVLVAGAQVILVEFARQRHAKGESALLLHSTLVFMGLAAPIYTCLLLTAPVISSIMVGHVETVFVNALRCITIGLVPQLVCGPAYFALIAQRRLPWVLGAHLLMLFVVMGGTLFAHSWLARVGVYSLAYLASMPMLMNGVRRERLIDASGARTLRTYFGLGGVLWAAGLVYSWIEITSPGSLFAACILCGACLLLVWRLAKFAIISSRAPDASHEASE